MLPISFPYRAYLERWLTPKSLAVLEAFLIGLVSGLSAVLLKLGVGWLGSLRVQASASFPAWLVLPLIGLSVGSLAGWLVRRFDPQAGGSGIPQVKASLSGLGTPLGGRVAVVKLITTMLALGSGLTLGRQGPTVQIGAGVAAWLSHWIPTSPNYRHQLIAAGAAAGLAAGFNAPIAGVLFVVEELLHDLSSFTLGPAIIASFVGAVVSRLLGGQGLDLNLEVTASVATFSAVEIPFYAILGVLAGGLGALFAEGVVASYKFQRHRLRWSLPVGIGVAALASGLVMATLPTFFRNNTGLREFLSTEEANPGIAALAFAVHFLLTIVAAGSGAPGGLFAPSLVIGASLGYLVGYWQSLILGVGSPTTFALAGMGAFFSAVARVPITAIVIVFEITTDFNLVLPLMIGSAIAYLIAEKLSQGSIFQKLLELQGYHLGDAKPNEDLLHKLKADDVMQRRVQTLTSDLNFYQVKQAFSASEHHGFPVLEGSKLVGIVTQRDVTDATKRNLPDDTPLKHIMTPRPITIQPTANLNEVLYLLKRYHLSRLPVLEGRKLVGIITQRDILQAELDYTNGQQQPNLGKTEPSYLVYQTRSPATGEGRLLVPMANPKHCGTLLQLAIAIAQEFNYEIECLHVIRISRQQIPSETPVNITGSRRLLRQATRLGRDRGVPVHTQVRVAHEISHAILEAIEESHIHLLLMGWKGKTRTPGQIFGNVVDTTLRQAACDVVVVKWGDNLPQALPPYPHRERIPPLFDRWLVPVRGGSNAHRAVELLPALLRVSSSQADVELLHVFPPSAAKPEETTIKREVAFLDRKLSCPVSAVAVPHTSVPEAVLERARQSRSDVILLGASREGILHQAIKGNIPEAIARGSDRTVILVRKSE